MTRTGHPQLAVERYGPGSVRRAGRSRAGRQHWGRPSPNCRWLVPADRPAVKPQGTCDPNIFHRKSARTHEELGYNPLLPCQSLANLCSWRRGEGRRRAPLVSGGRQRETKLPVGYELSKPPCTPAGKADGKVRTLASVWTIICLPTYVSGLLPVPKRELGQRDMGAAGRNAHCWACLSQLCLSIIKRAAPFIGRHYLPSGSLGTALHPFSAE